MINAKIMLDRAEEIYRTKLNDCEKELQETSIKSRKFDGLLNRYSNLIGLLLNKAEFDRRVVLTKEEEKEYNRLTKKENKKAKETK